MAIVYNQTLRTARMQAVVDAVDAGTAGKLYLMDGTRSQLTSVSLTNYLALFTLADPCGVVSGGVLTFSDFGSATGTAYASTGKTCSWAVLTTSAGAVIATLEVGAVGSGKDIELTSTTIAENDTVIVTAVRQITEGNPEVV